MRRFIGTRMLVLGATLAACLVATPRANAQDGLRLLRDAEIESTLRTYATPVFKAAGLDPQAVHIYIVNDPRLNSFVAAGQNLFMNSGTILRAQSPNQLVGIMAHETGHIAGGHLVRSTQMMRNAMIESIIGMVLGGAAAVTAHGNGGAGAIIAGESVGQRAYLQNSITIEASADQAALKFLDRTHQSARGLLQFFEILEQEEFLTAQHQDPYLQNHPLTQERINYVREHVAHSPWSNAKDPPEWIHLDQLMKAKLDAFLSDPQDVLQRYKPDDPSEAARYARAIAYYRIPDLAHALPLIDGLIKDYPSDPYFPELKGQMLFENGRVADAVAPYEHAVALMPTQPLLNIELAQVLLETGNPKLVQRAKDALNIALNTEPDNGDAWRFLAIAYGKSGNDAMASLALAEQHMAQGNYREARFQAQRAQKMLPPGAQRQRAQDLIDDAKRAQENQ
jgi:predicted Zn-dependent protease